MTSRRTFIRLAAFAGPALSAGGALAADPPILNEKDPQAVALGYFADAQTVPKAKYPKYAAGQTCANCQLFQAKAGSTTGPCPLFAGKHVAAKGWCSAYVKKAA